MRTVGLNHFETGLKKIYVKEGNAQIRFQRLSFLVAFSLTEEGWKGTTNSFVSAFNFLDPLTRCCFDIVGRTGGRKGSEQAVKGSRPMRACYLS